MICLKKYNVVSFFNMKEVFLHYIPNLETMVLATKEQEITKKTNSEKYVL